MLSIHPIKTEAMFLTKQGFIGPAPPILFGDKYVNVVDHTTCLGLTIDNCLSWSKHICHIKKLFSQKVGWCLKTYEAIAPKNVCRASLGHFVTLSLGLPDTKLPGIISWNECHHVTL